MEWAWRKSNQDMVAMNNIETDEKSPKQTDQEKGHN